MLLNQNNQNNQNLLTRDRISYSELKTWNDCSYKHKLVYLEEKPHFSSNEFTIFGTAVHRVCEEIVPDPSKDPQTIFDRVFAESLLELDSPNTSLVDEMKDQAKNIFPAILPALSSRFENYDVVSVEEQLLEPLARPADSPQKNFKGFIDLVIKTADGKHHIIDWKTCSWGWNARKKSDKILAYQLVLYKYFYSKKYNIPLENIESHFALLKRTATKNNVEFVSISSGDQRISNALNMLEKALKNIDKGFSIKNRLSCKYCPFYNTEDCT